MKTICNAFFAVMLLLVAIVTTAQAQQYPKATGYVNDFANLLTHEQGKSLNDELVAFEKKTTIEITVVTVPWLNNQSIEDYTRGLAKEWGVGKRGQNNGVVFLIAPKERKMRIQTASGVRAVLTDTRADQIRDNAVLPRFRASNIAQGIIDGTHEIMQVLDASAVSATLEKETSQVSPPVGMIKDKKVLVYVAGSITGVVLTFFIVAFAIRRVKARTFLLEHKGNLASQFTEAEKMARSFGVKEETRNKLIKLKDEFSLIDQLTAMSKGVNWFKLCDKFHSVDYSLSRIILSMKKEIAFAEEARKYVLEAKDSVASRFAEAEIMARSFGVKEETRNNLIKLKDEVSSIDRLTATSEGVNWLELRKKLDSMNYSLSLIVPNMKREILFAEKAQREGPELLKKIPGMIEAVEKKLAEGKLSPKAVKYFEEARRQYAQVQSQHSGMTMTDLVILYLILSSIQSNTANAESSYQYANTNHSDHSDHSNDYSSRSNSSNPSPSYGFGDTGGFSGGGGFDSSGGGSSGSW